jgi:hypothetical protein
LRNGLYDYGIESLPHRKDAKVAEKMIFFILAVRGRQNKNSRLFGAKMMSGSLPEAEWLPFIRPPLTAG